MFYLRRARFTEGLDACQKVTEAIEGAERQEERVQHSRLAARLLVWLAVLSMNLERFDEAKQFLQESQYILDDPTIGSTASYRRSGFFSWSSQGLLANLGFDSVLFY